MFNYYNLKDQSTERDEKNKIKEIEFMLKKIFI